MAEFEDESSKDPATELGRFPMRREPDEQTLEALHHASADPYDQLDQMIGESCRIVATPLLRLALEVAAFTFAGPATRHAQIQGVGLRIVGAAVTPDRGLASHPLCSDPP